MSFLTVLMLLLGAVFFGRDGKTGRGIAGISWVRKPFRWIRVIQQGRVEQPVNK